MKALEHLTNLGFINVGKWEDNSFIVKSNMAHNKDYYSCVYAISINEEIKYIGYTSQSIEDRIKNHETIKSHMKYFNNNSHVFMEFYQDISWGQYYLDLAQGMEYCMIDVFKPKWNIDGKPSKEKKGLEII
ncbi:MAG: hypothetical protein Q7J16_12720 [Candidatus Cloacimonadales bacterium]|nr:hypothetical protein [Candidatus Cloacimonadales bacterium]